jgi:hypothetical protein
MPDLTPDRSLRRPPPPGAVDDVVRRGRRRRLRVLGAGALAAVVLTAVPLGVLALSDRDADRLLSPATTSPTPTAAASAPPPEPCPASLRPDGARVPTPPPPELSDALVPREPPLAVTICRYGDIQYQGGGQSPQRPEEVALEGERAVSGGFDRLPDDLALPGGSGPGFCTAIGGAVIPYLVQLQYERTTVWLSTSSEPNSCAFVSNGTFVSAVYVGGQVAAAYETGTWPPPEPRWPGEPSACSAATRRAGQEHAMVPDGWVRLVVCRPSGGAFTTSGARLAASEVDRSRALDVARLLNSPPTTQLDGGCRLREGLVPTDQDAESPPWLVFDYAAGRDVLVSQFPPTCTPNLNNGTLAADLTAQQQAELLRLLGEG